MRSTLTRVILTITVAMGLLANGAGAQTSAPFSTADRSRVPYMTANSSPVMSCAALPGRLWGRTVPRRGRRSLAYP